MMIVVIIIVLVAVLGFGLLVFWLVRRTPENVPDVADARGAAHPRVVTTDEQGHAVADSDEPEAAPRDAGAFEGLLQDEIRDRGMRQPAADDDQPGAGQS